MSIPKSQNIKMIKSRKKINEKESYNTSKTSELVKTHEWDHGIMQNVKKNEVYWSNFKGQNQKE